MTGPTPAVRRLVKERSGGRCESCDTILSGFASVHHRIARGMGGSRDPKLNLPSNLLVLCGSGVSGCHGFTESRREEAYRHGLLVRRGDDPAVVPVMYRGAWVLLVDDGTTQASPVHVAWNLARSIIQREASPENLDLLLQATQAFDLTGEKATDTS